METTARLYTLNFDEAKTYIWATVFVACNLVLPQVFHLIPQGGVIFSPLSLVILVGAYKFGWKTGLLAALLSPVVNHLLTGMPAAEVMPVMALKLAVLAMVAGLAAQHFKTVSLPLLIWASSPLPVVSKPPSPTLPLAGLACCFRSSEPGSS